MELALGKPDVLKIDFNLDSVDSLTDFSKGFSYSDEQPNLASVFYNLFVDSGVKIN